ncbi:MAG: hypothetical protein QXI77_02740 [Nanopusillaceae archaeon]
MMYFVYKRTKHKKLTNFVYENCVKKINENLFVVECPFCSYFHLADNKILKRRIANLVRHITSQHAEI